MQGHQLVNHALFKQVLQTVGNNLAQKGKRASNTQDPQGATGQQTFNMDQLRSMVEKMGNSSDPVDARTLSNLLFLFATAARSDASRLIHLADLCKPIHFKHVGNLLLWILSAYALQGHAMQVLPHSQNAHLGPTLSSLAKYSNIWIHFMLSMKSAYTHHQHGPHEILRSETSISYFASQALHHAWCGLPWYRAARCRRTARLNSWAGCAPGVPLAAFKCSVRA